MEQYKSNAADILFEILQERKKQDAKFGIQNHSPIEWIAILGEEFGEASKEALEAHFKQKNNFGSLGKSEENLQNLRNELIQVAAVAAAFVECLDRNVWHQDNEE